MVTLTLFACHYLPLTSSHIQLKFSPVTLQQRCHLPHTFSGLLFVISKWQLIRYYKQSYNVPTFVVVTNLFKYKVLLTLSVQITAIYSRNKNVKCFKMPRIGLWSTQKWRRLNLSSTIGLSQVSQLYWHNLSFCPSSIINTPMFTFVPSSFKIKNAITVSVGKASLRRTHDGQRRVGKY